MTPSVYVIAGGGTSGHVNPALAIAEQIRANEPDAVIEFVGTQQGIENRLVRQAGFPFHVIRASGLPSRPSLAMVRAIRDYLAGRRQCLKLLRERRPHAVIGTGGYVCSPLVAAAAHLNIPVLLHEQNAYPGRSNRMMARRSQAVCLSFADAAPFFPKHTPLHLTGNPVRSVFFQQSHEHARKNAGISPETHLVLAVGGSLGARSINQAVLDLAAKLKALSADHPLRHLHVILGCGTQHEAAVRQAAAGLDWLDVHAYIDQIHEWMAAADLVIGRAGAGACFELAALGRPSILVPYPYAAGDHQTANAASLVKAGAAVLCKDQDLSAERLFSYFNELLTDRTVLQSMSTAALSLARPDAASEIYQHLRRIQKD